MKVKKFNAVDNHEALMKVRQELGPNAVILHQRRVKPKGLFGFLQKPMIEVVAAVEEQEQFHKPIPKMEPLRPETTLKSRVEKKQVITPHEGELSREIFEIKNMLSAVVKNVNKENLPDIIKNLESPDLTNIYLTLRDQEIEDEIIEEIIKELTIVVKSYGNDNINRGILKEKMMRLMDQYIIEGTEATSAKVIFFVGPTGVGKTTTIAKLAAQYSINEGKQVGFISADTYRIAAVEQLKIYSEILDIPIEVIYEPMEIHSAVEKLKHKDVIMVDTAGRSHRNHGQMGELQRLLDQIEDKEIYLVVSCTSKNKDVQEIIDSYQFLKDYKFIFTKIDEATTYGTILNTTVQTKKPVSFITTGQSVPDDIELIDIKRVMSLLLKGGLRDE